MATRIRARRRSARSWTSPEARLTEPTTRRRSSIEWRLPSASPRPRFPHRSCSGGSASCSRRSQTGDRSSRSSTTSTSRRRHSSSSSTTCTERCKARRSCCSPRRATSSSRRGPNGPPDTRRSRWSWNHSRPRTPRRSSAELLGGLERPVRQRITSAAEGNPLYVEQITAMLVESGAIRRDGDRWVATGSSRRHRHPADRRGPRRRASGCAAARGPPGDRSGLGDRPRLRRRSGRQPRSGRCGPGGPVASRVADDQAVRSPDCR